MAHAQKTDFVFRRKWRVDLNRQGRQFSRLLAVEVCASVVVMLDTPCSEVVWRVPDTHSIHQFLLHFPTRASPCAITFQLDSTFTALFHGFPQPFKAMSLIMFQNIPFPILSNSPFLSSCYPSSCHLCRWTKRWHFYRPCASLSIAP